MFCQGQASHSCILKRISAAALANAESIVLMFVLLCVQVNAILTYFSSGQCDRIWLCGDCAEETRIRVRRSFLADKLFFNKREELSQRDFTRLSRSRPLWPRTRTESGIGSPPHFGQSIKKQVLMDAAHFIALRGWAVLGKLVLYPSVTTTRTCRCHFVFLCVLTKFWLQILVVYLAFFNFIIPG